MKYHTTTDGQIGICCNDVHSCPKAISSEHFTSGQLALGFLMTREYERATSLYAEYDDNWKYAPASIH